jgi:hypothetical protein
VGERGGQPDIGSGTWNSPPGWGDRCRHAGWPDATLRDADDVLRALLPSELLERRSIQGRDTPVMEAVYHVVEHFAGHTGQIIWIAKMSVPGAVRFYEDGDGTATCFWERGV